MRTTCETCVFWQPQTAAAGTLTGFGQCRRQPPAIVLTPQGSRAMWPSVNRGEWCGEHATVERVDG